MPIVLKKAQRKRVKLKIGISAPSGAGKTASSLILAYGLLKGEHPDWPDDQIWEKIALIDTENGSGELYSRTKVGNTEIGEYNAISLEPPYEPQKYIDAIHACKDAGIEVCICDSLSHAWSGAGGLLEKQNNAAKRSGNSYTAWRDITPLHNQLVDSILQTDMHMICTMRAKTEYVQEKGENGKTTIRKVGLAPVQRDGMEYEFTMFLEIDADHQAYGSKDRTGIVDHQYFTITPDTGMKLAKWMESGVPASAQPKVVATIEATEAPCESLADVIAAIAKVAQELPDLGVSKPNIAAAIKGVTGGVVNYNNIEDINVAKQVLAALNEMKKEHQTA